MLNVRLAGGHLYGKQLFTGLSLVLSLMTSFCAVLFPTRCLGWDLGRNWVSFWGISRLLLIQMCMSRLNHNFHKSCCLGISVFCRGYDGMIVKQNFIFVWKTVLKFWSLTFFAQYIIVSPEGRGWLVIYVLFHKISVISGVWWWKTVRWKPVDYCKYSCLQQISYPGPLDQ